MISDLAPPFNVEDQKTLDQWIQAERRRHALPPRAAAYRDTILHWPLMIEWAEAAADEPDEIEELEMEF